MCGGGGLFEIWAVFPTSLGHPRRDQGHELLGGAVHVESCDVDGVRGGLLFFSGHAACHLALPNLPRGQCWKRQGERILHHLAPARAVSFCGMREAHNVHVVGECAGGAPDTRAHILGEAFRPAEVVEPVASPQVGGLELQHPWGEPLDPRLPHIRLNLGLGVDLGHDLAAKLVLDLLEDFFAKLGRREPEVRGGVGVDGEGIVSVFDLLRCAVGADLLRGRFSRDGEAEVLPGRLLVAVSFRPQAPNDSVVSLEPAMHGATLSARAIFLVRQHNEYPSW